MKNINHKNIKIIIYMKFSKKHGFYTGHRIRKNTKGSGYIKSDFSSSSFTQYNNRPCCNSIFDDFVVKGKKSFKKRKQYTKKNSKWARKPF